MNDLNHIADMKPFLGIDLTLDKKNETANGTEFLVQKPSDLLAKSWESTSEEAESTVERTKVPKFFRVMRYLCGISALIICIGILRADVSIAQAYQNAPGLFYAAGICGVIWLILWLCAGKKAKTVLEAEESKQTFSHLAHTASAIFQELGVPENAKDTDILFFFYKRKNGGIKVVEKAVVAQYFNPVFKVFRDSEQLYLANLEGKYAFPLSSVAEMHTVKKHIRIAGWNKDVPFNKGIYKQYKLTTDNYGCIHCRTYHILEIRQQRETFGIYIPSYELPVFEELLR